jgi:hypothetical protein
MSTYEQLKALQQLLNTLALEHDDEALRTRLRDGKLPPAFERADIPLEVLSASALHLIEYYAHMLCERLYGRMGVPRGEPHVKNEAIGGQASREECGHRRTCLVSYAPPRANRER